MKIILKYCLKIYLKYTTKLVLSIHRPVIIAVAGSINKHFIKQEINRIIQNSGHKTRSDAKNFNTDIGLPLAILDLPSGYNNYLDWLPAIFNAPRVIFKKEFPEYLVLSYGSSDLGDIKYLLTIAKPSIVVITDITQRYLEGFSGIKELINEYQLLASSLKENDLLILNYDNPKVLAIKNNVKTRVLTYGYNDGADFQAIKAVKTISGTDVTVRQGSDNQNFKIVKFGSHHIKALLVGLIINSHVIEKK